MAKKIPRKAKPKSKQPTSHPFMAARPVDLARFTSVAGKGPHKDRAGTQLVTSTISPGADKPGSRED